MGDTKENFSLEINKLIRSDFVYKNTNNKEYEFDTFQNEIKNREFNDLNRLELLFKIEIYMILFVYKNSDEVIFNGDLLNRYLQETNKNQKTISTSTSISSSRMQELNETNKTKLAFLLLALKKCNFPPLPRATPKLSESRSFTFVDNTEIVLLSDINNNSKEFEKYLKELTQLQKWLIKMGYKINSTDSDINTIAGNYIKTYFKTAYPHVNDPNKDLQIHTSLFGLSSNFEEMGEDFIKKYKPKQFLVELQRKIDPDSYKIIKDLYNQWLIKEHELIESEKLFLKDLASLATILPSEKTSLESVLKLIRNYFEFNKLQYEITTTKDNPSIDQKTNRGGGYKTYNNNNNLNNLLERLEKLENIVSNKIDKIDKIEGGANGENINKDPPSEKAKPQEDNNLPAAAPSIPTNEILEKSKKVLELIDTIKKNIKTYNESISNIDSTYTKVYSKLLDDDNADDTDTSKNRNKLFIAIENYLSISKDPSKAGNKQSLEQEINSYGKELESGKEWIKTVDEELKKNKILLNEIYKQVTNLLKSEQKTKELTDKLETIKKLFEGDDTIKEKDDTNIKFYQGKGLTSTIEILRTKITNNYQKYNSKAKGIIESIEKENKKELELKKATNPQIRGQSMPQQIVVAAPQNVGVGGADEVSKGGADEVSKSGTVGNSVETIFGFLNTLQDSLKDSLDPLAKKYKNSADPLFSSTLSEPSIFAKLYNKYIDDKQSKGDLIASNNFVESLRSNSLLPTDVLKINSTDKIIFVFVTLFIRLITVTVVETMITKNLIKNITFSLLVYFVLYTTLLAGAIALVNYDTYRMRIVFSYLNLNGNKPGIYAHISTLFIISFLIFYMNTQLNPDLMKQPAGNLSDQDKVSLMYKFEIISMITWFFLLIIIALR